MLFLPDAPTFPYGTHYYRAPTPTPDEWAGDLAELRRKGYTHIQIRPQWRWHERIRGQYTWNDLDTLMDMAHENHLKVVIQPMQETAPDWVFRELNGTRIGFNGVPILPIAQGAFYVGGWLPCFDNPAVHQAAYNFTYELAKHTAKHPAMWFYSAWNEPRSRPLGECRCEHSQRAFREWLKAKYHTIEEMNAALGKAWTSFEDVHPAESHTDYTEFYLWCRWVDTSVADRVKLSCDAIRAGAPGKPILCHTCLDVVRDPVMDAGSDELNRPHADCYGCSLAVDIYPGSNYSLWNETLYQSAWLRRLDAENFMVHEFYPSYSFGQRNTPEVLAAILLMALAGGSRAFTFWQYRCERYGVETDGYGIRGIDGEPNEDTQVCDDVAAMLQKAGSDFRRSNVTPGKVAVLNQRGNDILERIQNVQCGNFSLFMDHEHNLPATNGRQAARHWMAINRLCGVETEFASVASDWSNFKVLIVSFQALLEEPLAQKLTAFVQAGGTLIVEAPFGDRDDRMWMRGKAPGLGLEKLTGCWIRFGRKDEFGRHKTIQRTDGGTIAVDGGVCDLVPLPGAEVLGHWSDKPQTAAFVKNRFGKGVVWTLGASMALEWDEKSLPEAQAELLKMFYAGSGVEVQAPDALWTVDRTTENEVWRFRFWLGENSRTVNLDGEEVLYASNAKVCANAATLSNPAVIVTHKKHANC